MAMIDYGAVLKKNGVLQNLNADLFMDMKEAVGFTLDKAVYSYVWKSSDSEMFNVKRGEMYHEERRIEGNQFVYFGDEELLFCVYKTAVTIVSNKKNAEVIWFPYDISKFVLKKDVFGVIINIKKIDNNKFILNVNYKGNKYEVLYGYGIDNSIRIFKKISRKKLYGYTNKVTRRVNNFIFSK